MMTAFMNIHAVLNTAKELEILSGKQYWQIACTEWKDMM